ncbi:RluA family pseudouridine synthase [Candidatus Acetothermia bacterium]|nr:RluA family pseudouridine synthase [Candidatus Acetothermia bacterium]
MTAGLSVKNWILFEDESLLVLNKPAGLAMHNDARQSHEQTAISLVHQYLEQTQPELLRQPDFSPAFMHRLDKETSGVLVLAKTHEALKNLNRQLKFKQTKKTYFALVRGELREIGSIRLRLSKQFNRKRWKEMMVVDKQNGMHAQTDYRVLEKFDGCWGKLSLIEVSPITGRMHQIRAHFAAIQHPIVGDVLYGDSELNQQFAHEMQFTRQFLHCAGMTFTHPQTQIPIEFRALLTTELEALLECLRAAAPSTQ